MSHTNRICDRDQARRELADSIRDGDVWIIGTTPESLDHVLAHCQETWNTITYLDAGLPTVLIGTPKTALVTSMVIPRRSSAIFVIPKADASPSEIMSLDPTHQQIKDDGSQDIVLFSETLDAENEAVYMPALLMEAAELAGA